MKFAYTVALVSALAASPVLAQQGGRPADPLYFGAKAGSVDVDVSPFDNASNLGLYVGYKLYEDPSGAFFVEGEYTRTFNDGDVGAGEWDIETLAGYVGYRTAGPWFLKARAGYGYYDLSVTGVGTSVEGDETNLTFGAGGGFRLDQDLGIELEYTYIDDDISSLMFAVFTRF